MIVAAAVLLFGGYFVYDQVEGPARAGSARSPTTPGPGTGRSPITIPEGATLDDIGDLLVADDVVKSTDAWDKAVRAEERATSVQPGRYLMQNQMPAVDALGAADQPRQSRVRTEFTIPEGLRLSEQVDALAKGTKIKKSRYQKALKKPKRAGAADVRQEPARGLPLPRHLRADRGRDGDARRCGRWSTQYKAVTDDIGLEARRQEARPDARTRC